MKASPQKLAALRTKRRRAWYRKQEYCSAFELPSDVFLAAAFPVLQAQVAESIKRNNALLRRLKKRKKRAA